MLSRCLGAPCLYTICRGVDTTGWRYLHVPTRHEFSEPRPSLARFSCDGSVEVASACRADPRDRTQRSRRCDGRQQTSRGRTMEEMPYSNSCASDSDSLKMAENCRRALLNRTISRLLSGRVRNRRRLLRVHGMRVPHLGRTFVSVRWRWHSAPEKIVQRRRPTTASLSPTMSSMTSVRPPRFIPTEGWHQLHPVHTPTVRGHASEACRHQSLRIRLEEKCTE